VAIIGVNKMMMRPVWDGGAFVPRKMMNLSSSFDHRVVDGWDASAASSRSSSVATTGSRPTNSGISPALVTSR